MQIARPYLSRISRLILIGAAVLLLVPQGAPAHAPSDVQLALDQGNGILSVTITHTVADPSTHYVKRVLITTGGSVIRDTAYTSQPSPQTFTYTYLLPSGVNGEVQVKAECSILGSITRSIQAEVAPPAGITVPEPSIPVSVRPPVEPVDTGTSQPAAGASPPAVMPTKAGAGLIPIAAAMALVVLRFRR